MKKYLLIVIFSFLIFCTNINLIGQENNLFINENPAFNSFEFFIYSFSYINNYKGFNIFSFNILNWIYLSYYYNLQNAENFFFTGIPLYYNFKNYPAAFGFLISNQYLNFGYYIKLFSFMENGLSIFYPLKDNFYLLYNYTYKITLSFRFFQNLKLISGIYFDNTIFENNYPVDGIFKEIINWQIGFSIYFYDSYFLINYHSKNFLELYFYFYKNFSLFSIFFLFDKYINTYSFGFSISQSTKYHENGETKNLYIIDFNKIKPDANLYLKLRRQSRLENNYYLFLTGKFLKDISDLEDINALIKELKKKNKCFVFINEPDLFNIAFASNFDLIFIDKYKKISFSKNKIEEKIAENLINYFINYLNLYYPEISINEELKEYFRKELNNKDEYLKYIDQVLNYLVEMIFENRKIEKPILYDLILNNNFIQLNMLLEIGLVDYIILEQDLIKKIKSIFKQNNIVVKNVEEIFIENNKIYKSNFEKKYKIAIVYLSEIIASENISNYYYNILSFTKFNKVIKKIENENYEAIFIIINSPIGDIKEGEKILSLIADLSKKNKLFLLTNSMVCLGSAVLSLINNNSFTHQNTLFITNIFPIFSSILVNYNFFSEDMIKSYDEKIFEAIEKNRNLDKKEITYILERVIFSGFQAVGFNLSDFVIVFNSLIDLIFEKLSLNENDVYFDIIYASYSYEKLSWLQFFRLIINQFLEYFEN